MSLASSTSTSDAPAVVSQDALLQRVSVALSPELSGILELLDENESEWQQCCCKNSRCLKLYCECFSAGKYCDSTHCNCVQCSNNLEHEGERREAIQVTLLRKPNAFRQKISRNVVSKHSKGCNCRRSVCLKKYCECFEANVFCTDICKCVGCLNFKTSAEREIAIKAAENKRKTPRVDSVGAAAKRGKHKATDDSNNEDKEDWGHGGSKKSRELYTRLSLNLRKELPSNGTLSSGGGANMGLGRFTPAPLAGLVGQDLIEQTCIDMIGQARALQAKCDSATNSTNSKQKEKDAPVTGELECGEGSVEMENSTTSKDAVQEREILLRLKDTLTRLNKEANKT